MRALDRLVVRQFIDHALAMGRGGFFRGRTRSMKGSSTCSPDSQHPNSRKRESCAASIFDRVQAQVSGCGSFCPDPVHLRLGRASRDDALSCPATGWGMVLSGTVLLELCLPDRPAKTVSLLREGDIWSVPRGLGGVMRCAPRSGAELLYFAAGDRTDAEDSFDVFSDTEYASDVFCRRQNESPWLETGWGRLRIVEGCDFADPGALSAVLVEIDPGCRTDLHWHLNAGAWQIVLAGSGVLTQLARCGTLEESALSVGISSHITRGEGHFIGNWSQKPLRVLKLFASDHYHDLTLPQWLAASSPDEVAAHLHLPPECMTDFCMTGFSRH